MLRKSTLLLALIIWTGGSAMAQETLCTNGYVVHPILPETFIDGDYVLIGRQPGGKGAYHGQARISSDNCSVSIRRRTDGAETTILGGWRSLDHPEGAFALEFRTSDGDEYWSCQMSVDLDNYARLTCFRIQISSPDGEPGLEAFFPTATWPDSMPGKHFQ